MTISRRTILASAAMLGLPKVLIDTALAQTSPVRVRENIQTFAQDPQKVAALRAGVQQMQMRSTANRDDPLGWYYWAAVHGTTDDPGSMQDVYNRCQHSSFQQAPFQPTNVAQHFVSWHRPFLFFFEATLKQAAADAGVATAFELPYWNWYADGDMPTIFTEGTASSNPLLHPRASDSLDSTQLDRSAFTQTNLLPSSIPQWRRAFTVPFELDPHGSVHDLIGGDMGNIRRSARDPIFWVHHANIDRLWTVWTKMSGHNNPAPSSSWAQQSFTYDQAGQMVQRAGAVVDTQAGLGYRYDDETTLPEAQPVAVSQATVVVAQASVHPDASTSGQSMSMSGAVPSSADTVSSASALSLGGRSVAVDLKLPETSQTQLHSFANSVAPSGADALTGAWLVLNDVEIGPDGQNGGFSFNILATLPDDGKGAKTVKLGQLGTFTWPGATGAADAHDHDHGYKPINLTIPLKEVLQETGITNPADLAKGLRIVFQAAHREKPGAPAPQYVKIGSISIKTSSAPLQ